MLRKLSILIAGSLIMGGAVVSPTLASLTWDKTTIDGQSGDVGNFVSLRLDGSNNANISYISTSQGEVKYIQQTGASTWDTRNVDGIFSLEAGTSLTLPNDVADIIYYDSDSAQIRHAREDGASWSVDAIDSVSSSTTGVGFDSAVSLINALAVAYTTDNAGILNYAQYNEALKNWAVETVDSSGGAGWETSLTFDSNNIPHISYFNAAQGKLMYASNSGSGWSSVPVAAPAGVAVGRYSSLQFDSSNSAHISYYDVTNGDLKYASWDNITSTWNTETVDSAGDVGKFDSLTIHNNDPYISYYDATNGALKYAYKEGGVWYNGIIDNTSNDVGSSSSLTVDSSGNLHVAYYDATNENLKYATSTGAAPVPEPSGLIALCGGLSALAAFVRRSKK